MSPNGSGRPARGMVRRGARCGWLLDSALAATQPTARASVVVVGGGAFGAWTALHLREMGHSVTLLDAYGPGNSRATSGDETRQIRFGYGDRELYSRSALPGFTAWEARPEEFDSGKIGAVPCPEGIGAVRVPPTGPCLTADDRWAIQMELFIQMQVGTVVGAPG